MAAKAIEILKQMYPPHPDGTSLTSVSYFYIKDDDPDLQDLTQLLKTVALQITEANDRFKKFAMSVAKKNDNLISPKRIWENLFLEFFTDDALPSAMTSLAYIIIDGLDEFPEKERVQFLLCLTSLIVGTETGRRCRIQVAIFARPSIQADPGFDHIGFQSRKKVIEVTPKRNEKDIAAFIQFRLRSVKVLRTLNTRGTPDAARQFKTLVRQITISIREKSHGMFKWAGLAFDQIWKLQSPEAIVMALNKAPQGLEEMIHHSLKRLELEEPTRVVYMRSLMMLVLCAFQPLNIADIWVLLLLILDEHCYEIEHDLQGRYASIFEMLGEVNKETIASRGEEPRAEESTSFFYKLDMLSGDDVDEPESDVDDDKVTPDSSYISDSGTKNDQGFHGQHTDLEPRWSKVIVTFSHASIRDYLEHEGDPTTRRWHNCGLIVDNLSAAHLRLALVCIRILRSDITESYDVRSLRRYAQLNYMKHLACVDFAKLNPSDYTEEIRLLAELLYDGKSFLATSFDDVRDRYSKGYSMRKHFIQTWFGTSTYSTKVRQALGQILEYLDGELKNWAKSAIKSARVLFEPMAAACRHTWLTKERLGRQGIP